MASVQSAWSTRGLELIKLEATADALIIIDDCKFPCHKAVLIMASEFFEKLFLNDCKERSSGEVHVKDVAPDIFKLFRNYIYSRDENMFKNTTDIELIHLLTCSNMWLADPVKWICIEKLVGRMKIMSVGHLVQLFALAHSCNIKPLIDSIAKQFAERQKELNCPEAAELSFDCFKFFLEYVEFEFDKFKIIQNWVEKSGIRQPKHVFPFPIKEGNVDDNIEDTNEPCKQLNSLLNCINYFNMSVEEFYQGPWSSNFFDVPWKLKNYAEIRQNDYETPSYNTNYATLSYDTDYEALRYDTDYKTPSHYILVEILGKAHLFNNDAVLASVIQDLKNCESMDFESMDCLQAIAALNAECFQIYINSINVREIKKFKITEKWIVANLTSDVDNETKQKLLNNINYDAMTVTEFELGPGKSSLIDGDTKYKYLLSISKKNNAKRNYY